MGAEGRSPGSKAPGTAAPGAEGRAVSVSRGAMSAPAVNDGLTRPSAEVPETCLTDWDAPNELRPNEQRMASRVVLLERLINRISVCRQGNAHKDGVAGAQK